MKKNSGFKSPTICRKALVVGVGRGSKPPPSCKAVALTALRMSTRLRRSAIGACKHCSLFPFPCSLYFCTYSIINNYHIFKEKAVKIITLYFIPIYLLVGCCFFWRWLLFSIRHPNTNVFDKFLSFMIFLITTSLWIFVVPVHGVNFIQSRKLESITIISVLFIILFISKY